MSGLSKARLAAISAASLLVMMAVVGLAQYLVSRDGEIKPGAMIAISVPAGLLLARGWAAKAAKKT